MGKRCLKTLMEFEGNPDTSELIKLLARIGAITVSGDEIESYVTSRPLFANRIVYENLIPLLQNLPLQYDRRPHKSKDYESWDIFINIDEAKCFSRGIRKYPVWLLYEKMHPKKRKVVKIS